jgi:hypothetical protein
MTVLSLPDIANFINQQLLEHEEVCASLAQAEAMAFVACTKDFTQQSDEHQENYLWSLRNLLASAKERHQNVLNQWYTQFKTLKD